MIETYDKEVGVNLRLLAVEQKEEAGKGQLCQWSALQSLVPKVCFNHRILVVISQIFTWYV